MGAGIEFMGKVVEYGPQTAKAFKNYVEGFAWVMGKSNDMSRDQIISVLSKIVEQTVQHMPLP